MSKCQIPQGNDFGWPQRCFFSALIKYSNRNTTLACAIPRLLWSHRQALQRSATCNCLIHKRVPFQKMIKPALIPAKQKNEFSVPTSESCTDDDINPQAVGKLSWSQQRVVNSWPFCDMIHWQVYQYIYRSHTLYDQIWSDMSIWIYSHVQSRDSYRYSHFCWLIALAEASSGSSHTWRKLPYFGSFKLVLIPMFLAWAPFLEKTVFFWLLPPVLLVKNHSLLVHMSTFCGSKLQKLPVFVG